VSVHNLPNVLDGDLDGLIDELIAIDQAQRLADLEHVPAAAGAGAH
jgi:protein subunit release factor A